MLDSIEFIWAARAASSMTPVLIAFGFLFLTEPSAVAPDPRGPFRVYQRQSTVTAKHRSPNSHWEETHHLIRKPSPGSGATALGSVMLASLTPGTRSPIQNKTVANPFQVRDRLKTFAALASKSDGLRCKCYPGRVPTTDATSARTTNAVTGFRHFVSLTRVSDYRKSRKLCQAAPCRKGIPACPRFQGGLFAFTTASLRARQAGMPVLLIQPGPSAKA
jgi:hypothetical protein